MVVLTFPISPKNSPETILVLRSPFEIASSDLNEQSKYLEKVTTYTKECYRECAPWQTDCLSAIRYLFKKSSRNEFELDFVGNMPKTLYRWGWSILRVKKTCLKAGDLIFVGTNKRQISHVAIALSSEQIYHSSQKKNGCIEKIETLFREYLQPKTISELLAYTDERGTLSKRFYQKHSRVVQSCRNH